MKIATADLVPFKDQPYKVCDDESMEERTESVREYGILNPLIVRPLEGKEGKYEVISGHRRLFAARKAGLDKLPCTVHSVDRDEATVMMVDSNCQRTELKFSEKAFAYKMKLEALEHQGKACGQVGHKSRDEVSDEDSGRQVQRYIRLTKLIPELLQVMDDGDMAFSVGVQLSYLAEEFQRYVYEAMALNDCTPSYSQSVAMRKAAFAESLDEQTVGEIMCQQKANQKPIVKIPLERISNVLPYGFDSQRTEDYIVKALEHYKKYLDRQREQAR